MAFRIAAGSLQLGRVHLHALEFARRRDHQKIRAGGAAFQRGRSQPGMKAALRRVAEDALEHAAAARGALQRESAQLSCTPVHGPS